MKHRILLGALMFVGLSWPAHAQAPVPTPRDSYAEASPTRVPAFAETNGVCGPPGRIWARGEYLLWWTQGFQLPALLTTSPSGTPLVNASVLGESGTSVVFGDSRTESPVRSGGRFTLGGWLNDCQTWGVEGGVLFLGNQTTRFATAAEGTPILGRPFYDLQGNQQNAILISYPGFVRGTFEATTYSQFWGGEAYVRRNLWCDSCRHRVDLLVGFRYLNLHENLTINETEIDNDPNSRLFGERVDLTDSFTTRNQFFGGLLGIAGEHHWDRFFVQTTVKVALGGTCRSADIDGSTLFIGSGLPAARGGILALPSNMGTHNSSGFSVVPEVNLNFGMQVTKCLRCSAGYSFLYWSDVARPGSQIDTTINASQPPLGTGLVGEARPAFNGRTSDFWAQGINFGLEFRY